MKTRRFITMLAMCAVSLAAVAQSRIILPKHGLIPPDSTDVAYYGKRDFPQAALSVMGLNLGIWAFDRYVKKADYAYISWESIKENLSHGFVWDNDALGNNMFLHPYHGGLYYNAGRANGFNFWQSGLFTLAGSGMWELLFEQEYPSINDIVATPVGGVSIGEVTYRFSDMVVDDRAEGWNRFGREAAVFLISPMRGLTRVINGDAWRHRDTPGRTCGTPDLFMEISAGARALGFDNTFLNDRGLGFTTEFDVEYGNRFAMRTRHPYDYFKMRVNIVIDGSQSPLSQVNIMGRLLSREIIDTKDNDVSIGLYQHFDYYDSDTISDKTAKTPYKFGVPAALGAGILYKGNLPGASEIDAHLHTNALIVGGVLSDHYLLDQRNYNMGSGFGLKAGVNYIYGRDRFSISANYDYYRLFTWGYPRGTDLTKADPKSFNSPGDDSVAYFGVFDLRADLRLLPRIYLTAGFTHYTRSTRYRDFPDVKSESFATRLMLTYQL